MKLQNKLLDKFKKNIIISVQASSGEFFYEDDHLLCMAKSVIQGGASGLRLAGPDFIKKIKKITEIPVIGLTKPDPMPENWKDNIYITENFEQAGKLAQAGADIIAIDATLRKRRFETLEELIFKIKNELNKPVIADISNIKEGLNSSRLEADIISTTLSGYTSYTLEKNNDKPDFELLKELVKNQNKPVILEGRVWRTEDVKMAFEAGAFSVVIGTAVTRPRLITERFVKAAKNSS